MLVAVFAEDVLCDDSRLALDDPGVRDDAEHPVDRFVIAKEAFGPAASCILLRERLLVDAASRAEPPIDLEREYGVALSTR